MHTAKGCGFRKFVAHHYTRPFLARGRPSVFNKMISCGALE
jgi:hypothetical protein